MLHWRQSFAEPVEFLSIWVGLIPAGTLEYVVHGIEIFIVHFADALDRKIVGGPLPAYGRPNVADVLGRPHELFEGAAPISSNAVEIVLGESTPVGRNDRGAGKHRLNLDAAERFDKGRGQDHGFGLGHEPFPGLYIGDTDMLHVFRHWAARAGAEPPETAGARNDQLAADRLDDLHRDVHALSGANAPKI